MSALFVYPPNGSYGLVSDIDYLSVTYTSSWSALNFSMRCLIGEPLTWFECYNAPSNPLPGDGTWIFYLWQYVRNASDGPIQCAFDLKRYQHPEDVVSGSPFSVTHGISQVTRMTSYTLVKPTSIASTTATTTPNANAISSPAITTPTSSTSPSSSSSNDGAQPTLSKGAKIGIGVGATFGVVFLAALFCIIVAQRRKLGQMKRESQQLRSVYSGTRSELPEGSTQEQKHLSELSGDYRYINATQPQSGVNRPQHGNVTVMRELL